jgi:uncharacterized integral membrane protein
MDENRIKYILNIFIFVFVLLIFALINTMGIKLNTMEGFEDATIPTGATAFCESYKGSSAQLNTECGRLTQKNCNETSCCVFANNKCVAGSANGPTYNTDNNGNTTTSSYYFQNQCFGSNCPS